MKTTKTVISRSALALCLGVMLAIPANAAKWIKKDAGTYSWTDTGNWENSTLPTATTDAALNDNSYRPTGNQTITGDGTAKSLDLHNTVPGRARTFTGNITASNLVLRVGTMNVEGTLTLTGTDQTYSLVGAAYQDSSYGGTLDIKSGGSVIGNGVHAISLGRRADTKDDDAAGRILLRDGGKLVLNPSGSTAPLAGLMLGRNDGERKGTYGASYIQYGGEAVLGRFLTGYEENTFGTMAILGGKLDLPYISNDTRFRIGHKGYGMFYIHGGEIFLETNKSAVAIASLGNLYDTGRTWAMDIGSGYSVSDGLKGAFLYADGGSLKTPVNVDIHGTSYSKTGAAPAHMTVDGSADMTIRQMRVGANAGDGRASLNLNGGTLTTDALCANPGHTGIKEVNGNGGKLVFPGSAVQVQGLGLDAINIYEGGLTVECGGHAISLGNAATNVILRTPGGYGVDIASVTDINSSFSAPWIDISGGSGSNATAVALVDFDTSITTNAVIACRGEGYAAGDTVTATVIRPYGTKTFADRIILSVSENKPGALVKTGGYNLNLFAQPEFEGTYEVRQGYVIQSTAAGVASPKVKAIVVGGTNDATFQAGSGNNTAIEANWNPINPEATLTLGTSHGFGCLKVPNGADEKPFEQTFASLSVSGTGNTILSANNSGAGTKLTFGTISCAEGSELTIPKWDGTFKVYVDTAKTPVGTRFQNIKFADDDVHFAQVGEDGQLVKNTEGLLIIVR